MSTQDLTDAEFAELDELLAATPEPLQPLDASMLDGYLCGVIVQPRLVELDEWLPNIFDYDGGRLPETVDAAWLDRLTELVSRRHAALNRGLVEDGWFDPVILDIAGPELSFTAAATPDPAKVEKLLAKRDFAAGAGNALMQGSKLQAVAAAFQCKCF